MLFAFGVVASTVLTWWFATGAVLFVARRSDGRAHQIMTAMTVLAAGCMVGLYATAQAMSTPSVFGAFLCAIGVWAWVEMSFLTGLVTGPRRTPCPGHLVGKRRFQAAWLAVRDHELVILATGIAVLALTYTGENLTGLYVYLILWGMRISAKLNIFLGAPNAISDMIPERLLYLTSYFRTDRISPLFWPAVLTAGAIFCWLCSAAISSLGGAAFTSHILLASFLGLGILEKLFLVLNISDAALWSWAIPKPKDESATAAQPKLKMSPLAMA
ncbi:MAG: putative photosynthetic complex assembly protein PuhE, partial [Pseudomonadota bacterium]